MARSLRRSCHSSAFFGPHVTLSGGIAEQTQATCILPRVLGGSYTASGSNGIVTAPNAAQHITKVAESGSQIKHGVVDFQFSHSSAIDGRLQFGFSTSCLVMTLHVFWPTSCTLSIGWSFCRHQHNCMKNVWSKSAIETPFECRAKSPNDGKCCWECCVIRHSYQPAIWFSQFLGNWWYIPVFCTEIILPDRKLS